MARFEGNFPDEPKEAPKWFLTFFKNYGLVIKYLNAVGKRGISAEDNIINSSVSVRVTHGVAARFQHNLNALPVLVQPQGGRFICYTQNPSDSSASSLTFYLISSPVTSTESAGVIDFVEVLDAMLFRLNDQVTIGDQTRKILRLDGNRITLDATIRLTLPTVVVLNTEAITVNFL